MSKARQIISIGGGGFGRNPGQGIIEQYILDQTKKRRPKICFIPTATGDLEAYKLNYYATFANLNCQPTHLDFFKRTPDLENLILKEGPETIAALVAEPVMGAGGVIPPSEGYFQAIQPILKKYKIALISDEVICGFGRTGPIWGCQAYDFVPDAIISSKNLTAGYFPMGAVILLSLIHI